MLDKKEGSTDILKNEKVLLEELDSVEFVKYCGLGPNLVIRGLDPSIFSSTIIFLFTSRSCARSRFTSFTYVLRYIFTLSMFFCK